jgi:hypothetical protein
MKIDQLASMVIAAIALLLGPLGWYIAYRTTVRRDQLAKKRDLRIQYLIDAYRRLESAANRTNAQTQELESAVADIQLFGSAEQITLVRKFAEEFAAERSAGLEDLLESLRADLRKELDLGISPAKIVHLRILPGRARK